MEIKKITQEEFDKIYEEHQKWLEYPGNGAKGDFSHIDLTSIQFPQEKNSRIYNDRSTRFKYPFKIVYLCSCVLRGANLTGIDLSNFDLSYADLSYANLSNCNLQTTYLSNANLEGANLQHTNLIDTDLGCI